MKRSIEDLRIGQRVTVPSLGNDLAIIVGLRRDPKAFYFDEVTVRVKQGFDYDGFEPKDVVPVPESSQP